MMNVQFFYALLPKRLYTWLMGRLSRTRIGFLKRWFVGVVGIKLDDALIRDASAYESIQAIFVRKINLEKRRMDISEQLIASPVDGRLLLADQIEGNAIMQVKGVSYELDDLIIHKHADLLGGSYANFYLSPQDYHWFHAPMDGVLFDVLYVPGALYPVKMSLVESFSGLYARNERVVFCFRNEARDFVWYLVAVGAMGVGSIYFFNKGSPICVNKNFGQVQSQLIRKGDSLGYFCFGSSVLLVSEKPIMWEDAHDEFYEVQVRQTIGCFK